MQHIRGFDGLRAIAVIGVMLFHMGWFKLGWAGVPLFFVLSGFLITGILIDNRPAEARTYFSAFYLRRTLRIFPLYFLYLGAVAGLYAYVDVYTGTWGWFALYVQNYYLAAHNFQLTPWMPLLHTWTLAVEEQFYLIWPLVVFFTPAKALKHLVIALIVGSFASHAWLNEFVSFWSFAFLSSNLSSLCLGAYLAIVARESRQALHRVSIGLLAVGAAAAVAIFSLPLVSRIEYSPVLTFSLTVLFAGIVGTVAVSQRTAILDWPPLAYVGRISYGLYIWHLFAIALINIAIYHKWIPEISDPVRDILRIVVSFSIAIVSFHAFESPMLTLKDRFTYKRTSRQLALNDTSA